MNKDFKHKKKWGQNFINDENIINKIVDLVPLENQNVIEIGPGLGALTKKIVNKAKKLDVYEIDVEAIDYLKANITNSNFTIHNQDFLLMNFEDYDHDNIVIGNIPYYITSDIIFKLLKNHQKISKAILMVQKEVAQRLVAQPNNKEYGKLTVSVTHFAKVTKALDILAKYFNPMPKVDSSIVVLEFNHKNNFDEFNQKFLNFIKHIFMFKRKTLMNNLKVFYDDDLKIKEVFHKNELDWNTRAEQLSYTKILQLYRDLY